MEEGLNLNLVLNGATLLSVLGLGVKVYLAGRAQRIEQPLSVRAADCSLPKEQCNERHATINDQIGNIYSRLARAERELSAYEAGHTALKERLDSMDAKLDALLKRGK